MTGKGDAFSRRAMLAAPAVLAFTSTGACAKDGGAAMTGSKMLVAYLTRSGNTRVIAETLHRELGCGLFEIRPARPYPQDYEQHVAQATRERDSGFEPVLAAKIENLADCRELYLGFPIWGETVPPPIRSFLKMHDLRGRAIRPFITHGGYGIGNAASVLASHAPAARIETPFVMEADQERRTLNQVRSWLGQSKG
ncbi:flavodoxin [Sphingomonas sp. NIBR02145]|uniref:flavodoxin n=1 Tax=Sphingomonas sp. NIBR02145 TaxID=3014784 RepID=UPI0022B3A4F3|nr:flavodoxin [Sphingomonas sp. NIBR02145]WHU03549.1 flavodoxin [Sphingomonas sp. NIBR02145]